MRDYTASVALDFIAEVADQLLPPHEPSERFFRLLIAVLEHIRSNPAGNVWASVAYFTLWAVRLSGFLPELRISEESRGIALEMMQTPIGQLTERTWSRETAADLRRQLVRAVEEHVERRLIPSAPSNPSESMDSFQQTLAKLKAFWSERGCIVTEPYDIEVGAGTMAPETFLRVLGPKPYRVAYVQPSRRPADGRYGENPNRLYKHRSFRSSSSRLPTT